MSVQITPRTGHDTAECTSTSDPEDRVPCFDHIIRKWCCVGSAILAIVSFIVVRPRSQRLAVLIRVWAVRSVCLVFVLSEVKVVKVTEVWCGYAGLPGRVGLWVVWLAH